MHIPFFVPKWAIVSFLIVVGALLGLKMHSSSSARTDRMASTYLPDDPYSQQSSGFNGDYSRDPGLTPPTGGSPYTTDDGASAAASGTHIAAMPGRDGKWHVVGSTYSPRTAVPIAAHYGGGLSTGSSTASGWYVPSPGSSHPSGSGTTPPSGSGTKPPTGWGDPPRASTTGSASAAKPLPLTIPPFFGQALFTPLAGAPSRAVSFSEWESYRTDVAGENILVTTDDSNFFRDRIGKINGNTGDTDASGLNVTDATDSIIRGTESADEAPWQVDPPDEDSGDTGDDSDAEDPGDTEDQASGDTQDQDVGDTQDQDVGDAPDENPGTNLNDMMMSSASSSSRATATAAVFATASCDPDGDDCPDLSSPEEWDFPYLQWVQSANRDTGTAVHTDEGTTLASGADVLVIGADGYDDDDNRAAGRNIIITRDDDNVVIGGTGKVNAQIGDSEQGAVIMDVHRVFIQGGGAY